MGSGQGVDSRGHRPVGSPSLGALGAGEALGDPGLRGPGAMGSGPDFGNGSGMPRGKRGETGYDKDGLGGPGGMESRFGDGFGYAGRTGPENRAGYGGASAVSGEMGSADGTGRGVASGAPGGTESEEGGGYRHGSTWVEGRGTGALESAIPGGGPDRAASWSGQAGFPYLGKGRALPVLAVVRGPRRERARRRSHQLVGFLHVPISSPQTSSLGLGLQTSRAKDRLTAHNLTITSRFMLGSVTWRGGDLPKVAQDVCG